MKFSFTIPLLAGIAIGAITTGIVTVAHNDFFWYRNMSTTEREASRKTSVDAAFIEHMVPHHEGAIAMANLALANAKTDEVKNLSKDIITSQQKEIDDMKAWYKEWFGEEMPSSVISSETTEDHAMHMDTMSGDVNTLEASTTFDKDFVTQMIPHHEMAIVMAQTTLRTSTRNEIKALAQSIIDTQTMEIEQMRSWLTTWE